MSQQKLAAIWAGAVAAGIYQFRGRARPATIQAQASAHGWRAFYLDGRRIVDKTSFLRECATAMHFPAYFGANWDALEECLTDLAWAPARGYLILYDDVAYFARANPPEWAVALAILHNATLAWAAHSTPFVGLLRRTGGTTPAVPVL